MHLPKPQTLQTKFISGLIIAVLTLGIIFSCGFYLHMRSVLEEEVHDKAQLIFNHVDSIQHYVREVLRPKMYANYPQTFILQAMSSSYISRKIMTQVNAPDDGTLYRRVAIGARNAHYEANDHERAFIDYFRENQDVTLWQGYQFINGEKYYIMSRPVRFTQGCMYCHGDAGKAPQMLLKTYGMRGFGKKEGAIAGVDVVGISVNNSVGRVERTIRTYFVCFGLGALLLFFASNVLFRVLVVNNLKRLQQALFSQVEQEQLNLPNDGGDEVQGLIDSIEEMSQHLLQAKVQLQHYTDNLRQMVEERTEALTKEVTARRDDVQLFVQILENMSLSTTRAELWRSTLPQICQRFQAESIFYICTMGTQDSFSWPESPLPPILPANVVEILTGSACVIEKNHAYIPVESSTGNAEGLLGMRWATEAQAREHDRNVLMALGRQLGSSADNITAIDSLLRQMLILQTIVDGITDPLVLLDGECTVLTVNTAARQLHSELSSGLRNDGNILPYFFPQEQPAQVLKETLAKGSPHIAEYTVGANRSFSLCLYPVKAQPEEVERIVLYARETTTEKQMQAQVWHAEKMATVGKLTAGLAHEINNPLGVILCYAGLLRQGIAEPGHLADLEVIERHTRQAQRVLKDLLGFARPKTAESGTTNGCAVLASIKEVFSVQAAKKGVELQLDLPPQPAWVQMGLGELEQVLSNLMMNALDAITVSNGIIRLRLRTLATNEIQIQVEDTGSGLSKEVASHAFDPFFSTKEIGAGTGLGLTVVYGMINDIGGRISIDSSQDLGGACFTLTLPQNLNFAHYPPDASE